MNYFAVGPFFLCACLRQPHNTFPELCCHWLCGKVDQRSGKLIPKTFTAGDIEARRLLAAANKHRGLCVCAYSCTSSQIVLHSGTRDHDVSDAWI